MSYWARWGFGWAGLTREASCGHVRQLLEFQAGCLGPNKIEGVAHTG